MENIEQLNSQPDTAVLEEPFGEEADTDRQQEIAPAAGELAINYYAEEDESVAEQLLTFDAAKALLAELAFGTSRSTEKLQRQQEALANSGSPDLRTRLSAIDGLLNMLEDHVIGFADASADLSLHEKAEYLRRFSAIRRALLHERSRVESMVRDSMLGQTAIVAEWASGQATGANSDSENTSDFNLDGSLAKSGENSSTASATTAKIGSTAAKNLVFFRANIGTLVHMLKQDLEWTVDSQTQRQQDRVDTVIQRPNTMKFMRQLWTAKTGQEITREQLARKSFWVSAWVTARWDVWDTVPNYHRRFALRHRLAK